MSELNYKLDKTLQTLIIAIFMFFFLPSVVLAQQAIIKYIEIKHDPLSVNIFLNQKTPVKVIKIDKKELLIALKNVTLAKGFTVKGKKNSSIKNVALESRQGNVVAVVLTSNRPYGYIKSAFNRSGTNFTISLEKKSKKSKKLASITPLISMDSEKKEKPTEKPAIVEREKQPLPAKEPSSMMIPEKQIEKAPLQKEIKVEKPKPINKIASKKNDKILTSTVYVPPQREKSRNKGDISDLARMIEGSECDTKQIGNALVFLKKNLYKEAFDILDQYIAQENITCREQAYFLRAYAFYRTVKKDDYANLIKAERFFHDALISYPNSSYIPFGYVSIGMIQKKLNNFSAAEGYFNIVKQGYLAYSGLPELMYHLADIYDEKGFLEKALRYYKQVFEDKVENAYIPDAGIGYGKALFKKRQYLKSLDILNYVVKENPKKVYESHELLLYIGNANFEVGFSKAARQSLTRLLNLFPEVEGRDVILSKVGDTYGMENNSAKAIKIYELVREKFPDSEGYIASSIGIARYLESDEKRIEIYKMIKEKFPENKFARIAMMRMAEIYQANGEYNKCINEIVDLLSAYPRGLRYEAVKLMQKAYEALFEKQLKSGEYTKVLNRYEIEHDRIDRMGSRKVALNVGLAYLQAKLYEESFNHLINAYKQYKRSSRSSALLFGLGVAMDESGRDDDALKMFEAFSKRFKKNEQTVDALKRMGNIYLENKKYKLSSTKFDQAYKAASDHLIKGNLLILRSMTYEEKGDMETASNLRERAIKEVALASGENYDVLTGAYKGLGHTYTSLKKYTKSADAYLKALNFSATDREKANLGFLLGDAYQKSNIITKAKEAYKQVITSYDSVWARLAQQRLNTLELAAMVQNS